MKKLSCCLSILLLSACSSSASKVSLFDGLPNPIKMFGKKTDMIVALGHKPLQNPGGVQFDSDPDFAKSYHIYQRKHNKVTGNTTKQLPPEEEIDEFSAYKLLGATVVDTSQAGWEADYIAPPKEKTFGEQIIDTLTPEDNSTDMFGRKTPSAQHLYDKAQQLSSSIFDSGKQFISDARDTAIEQQEQRAKSIFNSDQYEDKPMSDVRTTDHATAGVLHEEISSNAGQDLEQKHDVDEKAGFMSMIKGFLSSNSDNNLFTNNPHNSDQEEGSETTTINNHNQGSSLMSSVNSNSDNDEEKAEISAALPDNYQISKQKIAINELGKKNHKISPRLPKTQKK